MTNTQKIDSEELIRRMKNGEESAFTSLVRSNWDKVFSRAYGLLKNKEDAEEVAQDTFIRARNGVSNFRGECSASTWLHRIVTNLARNKYWYWWRRKRGQSVSIDAPLSESEENQTTLADTLQSETLTPCEDSLSAEFSEILPKAIASLDEKYSQVLSMRAQDDLSYEEISERLGITVGTVKSRLSRAREQLRDALENMGYSSKED